MSVRAAGGVGHYNPDRCAGVLVGSATGDALGAGYEFRTPPTGQAEMIGGGLGPWAPGEWTDDTQMALCIAEEAATGDLDALKVAGRFLAWYGEHPKDVGIQTSEVLGRAEAAADVARCAAERFARHPGSSAGNGSLMRTAAVALGALGDDSRLIEMAMEISALTHADPVTGEACALWCIGIDRALREGRLDGVEEGAKLLAPSRRDFWCERIEEARKRPPASFTPNGWVVTAFQAALSAVWQTPVPADLPARHLQDALQSAVKIGNDTDTVAAIAGGLLGARWGASAVPARWKAMLHGWPGYRASDLARLALLSAWGGEVDGAGWPSTPDMTGYYVDAWYAPPIAVPLDEDEGVVMANVFGVANVDADIVISLCRVGTRVPAASQRVEVVLMDSDKPADNPNLDFVLDDLASAIATWRDEGKRVAVHCVQAERRTPAVVAAYMAKRNSISGPEAWRRVAAQLPGARENPAFAAALGRLWPGRPKTTGQPT
ncbi:MAG TPA: ADP-ribosylglycohydrolase family protein [Acidimicrobiales bacterium]|nr:ADP-ribosylglycohydrolase family protein [Acidimicrobiales bacterium]